MRNYSPSFSILVHCNWRHIEEVANSVRERTTILQKLAGTNWGATPVSENGLCQLCTTGMTCRYDCDLKAVNACLLVVIRKQRKGAALPGMVIFTDSRALVQAVGDSSRGGVEEAMLLTDYLKKTGVRSVIQWLPPHVGVIGTR
ncbi:hypothetical protein PoB_006025200 [Plakobranchus ocellatus]|uniref:RNase H type-1 domain-containing protein n=1 Tax=Plakobranchus ocellatus TaxID=259542 RepID=A0AAV4CPF7_9GAST|nr:hypothetical protein PoB_006025200 [Plakobranchus ocellatus]